MLSLLLQHSKRKNILKYDEINMQQKLRAEAFAFECVNHLSVPSWWCCEEFPRCFIDVFHTYAHTYTDSDLPIFF